MTNWSWIDQALELHEEGLQVVALKRGDKIPCHQWQQWQTVRQTEDDLLDLADYFQSPEPPEWLGEEGRIHVGRPWLSNNYQARRLWPQPVALDIGIITGQLSGVVVVDIDTADAHDLARMHQLTNAAMAIQTNKGWHYWFAHPGTKLQNSASQGIEGMDIRADGGIARVPPSSGLKWLSRTGIDELPPYPGLPTLQKEPESADRLDALDLSEVSALNQTAEEWLHQTRKGEMISKGRRNETMKFVVGMLIAERRDKAWVLGEAQRLGALYWDHDKYAGKQTEIIVNSLWRLDEKNHPEEHQPEPEPAAKPLVGYLSDATAEKFIDNLPPRKPAFVETILEPGKATMVAGYSGSGKSELLMMLLKAACDPTKLGKFVGPWQIQATPKALVFDPENNPHLISDRLKRFSLIGHSGDNLRVVPGSVPGPDGMIDTALNLTTENGKRHLQRMIQHHAPDIVVFDTVRSHYPGLKENEASEWTAYNVLTQQLCRAGLCVVWLHHSNKPGADGHATEAGSSHVLTNISTQIFVTPVYADEAMAQRKHAIWNEDEKVQQTVKQVHCTPFEAVALTRQISDPLDRVTQISYGKVREASPITERRYYLAQVVDEQDGRPTLHSTMSPKEAAINMRMHPSINALADPLSAVSRALRVPVPLLVEWGLRAGDQGTSPELAQASPE